jgi:hypothetical protein
MDAGMVDRLSVRAQQDSGTSVKSDVATDDSQREVSDMESSQSPQPANPATPATPASTASSPAATAPEQRGQGPDRRQSVVDRRSGLERRQQSQEQTGYTGQERRIARADRRENTGLERRRGPGRRRSDDRKAAEEGEMTNEQFEFCMAIETYKKVNRKMFPTWTEVLEVMRQLGYRKVMGRNIKLENCPEPELFTVHDPSKDAA